MIIKTHILKLSNIYFDNKFIISDPPDNINKFISNYSIDKFTNIKNKKIITINNLLVIETLHSCFVHALIDNIFPIFWAINDIKNHEINLHDIPLFISRRKIDLYQKHNLPRINSNTKKYKGVYHDIISLINDNYIFEHLIDDKTSYFIKNCYFYIFDDKCQRSPWNCINYYYGRNININNTIFSDTEIKNQIIKFRNHVLDKTSNNCNKGKGIILINRREISRNINNLVLPLTNILNKFDNFKGVIYLEDLTFQEQINIFINNNIIIGPHGAGMIHNIWSSNKFVIEITFKDRDNKMYKRICDITDNHIIQISHDNIVDKIEKELNKIINKQN
tara:strand:- start:12152 stop:13153 length:1002 start_codon:yes stop_codon:yes gene_type:complete